MKEGWQRLSFEECIEKVPTTKKIPKKKFLSKGLYPIVSQEVNLVNGYWDRKEDLFIVKKPVILFGDHTKVIKYIDFSFVKGADGIKIFLPIKKLNSKFFAYQLQSLDLKDLGYARHYRLLKQKSIFIPPLSEQKQIVALLDQAFAAIDQAKANMERNIENARELFQSYLQNEIYEIENEFGREILSDHLELITYGFTNPMPTTLEGPYKVTAKNVNYGIVDWQNAKRTSQDAFDNLITDKSRPIIGDLLLTKDGTLGRLGIVEVSNLCINQSVALLRTKKDSLNPYFLKLILSSKPYQDLMISQAGGTTIKHIYITRVKKMAVPIPSLECQEIILKKAHSFMDKENGLLEFYKSKLQNLENLEKSLLQKAFAGELTKAV